MVRSRVPKPKKTWAEMMAGYKTYNPEVEGYGSSADWKSNFQETMGFQEAILVVPGCPRTILGVSKEATWDQIKAAYRKAALESHPDRHVLNNMT
jgi:hypothetical protein